MTGFYFNKGCVCPILSSEQDVIVREVFRIEGTAGPKGFAIESGA